MIDRGQGIRLESTPNGPRKVSSKRGIPVVDLNSFKVLNGLEVGESVKVVSSAGRIDILPTRRSFHIRESKKAWSNYRVLELFAGGGTFHDALGGIDAFKVVGALELESKFLNIYDRKFSDVETLLHGDIRDYEPDDLPRHDILVAGIPCTDHSIEGRSKKGLSTPEDGEIGNLYIDVLPMVRHHRPLAVVVENVPSYLTSEAGINLIRVLRQWGYSVTSQVIDPLQYGEITSRKRCVIVATQRGAFQIAAPSSLNQFRLSDFLDPEDPIQDKLDAERDAHSVNYLAERSRLMAEKGNGWRHQVFHRNHLGKVPTITRGYFKRQPQSWMIHTPFGPRMLRKHEIARIHGHSFPEDISASLTIEMSGQGVMSRVFNTIFTELYTFLESGHSEPKDSITEFAQSKDSQLRLFVC